VMLSVALLLPLQAISQQGAADSTNVLDDVLVEESFEVGFTEDKFPLQLGLDFSDVVKITERVSWDCIDPSFEQNPTAHTDGLELHLSHPELAAIRPAPVKIFYAKFQDIARWQLNITAGDGSLFRSIEGEGTPPERIAWDGRGDNGEPLVAGRNYAFSFTAVDRAGNKRTFPGQTFAVPAFYMREGHTTRIGVASSQLFLENGLGLNSQAQAYAREVADLIRQFSAQGRISVQGGGANQGEFLQLVARELAVDYKQFRSIKAAAGSRDDLILTVE
jgi:hypothetical protein